MRETSALLERLKERFESIDERADRRSVGMRSRDSFLSHFSERMNRLENMVNVSEMNAFRRLPKMRTGIDPWGSMGTWSVMKDLVYLDWLAEQEIEEEPEEQQSVSAWGRPTTSAFNSHRSAWLNTPYTPARVADKPTSRTRPARAPTLRPLNRALGRATVEHDSRKVTRQVASSLPPMLAKGVGRKWAEQKTKKDQVPLNKSIITARKFKTPSPMMRMVDQEVEQELSDRNVQPLSLAQGRAGNQDIGSSLLPKTFKKSSGVDFDDVQRIPGLQSLQVSRKRGLQTQVSKTQIIKNLRNVISSNRNRSTIDDSLEELIQTSTSKVVPLILKKRIEKIIRQEKLQKTVQNTVQRLAPEVSDQVRYQVLEIFKKAGVTHLDDVIRQTGQSSSAIQRVQDVVSQVVEQVIENSQQLIQVVREDSPIKDLTPVTSPQVKTIVEKLRSKGVSRSLAERALQSLPATSWTPDLIQELVQGTDDDHTTPNVQKRLQNQLERLTGTSTHIFKRERLVQRGQLTANRSILPRVVGEELPNRVVADLIDSITKLTNRETVIESSVGQQKLMQSVERAVGKMETVLRKMRVESFDWIDVQPAMAGDENNEESIREASSPWFTKNEIDNSQKTEQLQPVQQAASRFLKMLEQNPTRPEIIARQLGMREQEVSQVLKAIHSSSEVDTQSSSEIDIQLNSEIDIQSKKTLFERQEVKATERKSRGDHPLESLWERATSPIELPEWRGTGTDSFTPMIGQSAKTWRLDPKRKPVHPSSFHQESTLLSPVSPVDNFEEMNDDSSQSFKTPSPWMSSKQVGFGFTPESISGDARLTPTDVAQLGNAKSIRITAADVKGKKSHWLEPNRTVILDDGTVIHAKVARALGITPKRKLNTNAMPLAWTLEGVQLKSDHRSLPGWAKRASGKPQVSASPDFLLALARTSTADDVAELILQNTGSSESILPKTAMTAIEQIRKEAHKGLERLQTEVEEQTIVRDRDPRDRSRRRVSRTARSVLDGFTGLKPISTSAPAESGQAQAADKVSKLTRQLESLVSLAENNRRDEAREGVRMAEDSHDAMAEGQTQAAEEQQDHSADIEALRREVLSVFELELSLRSIRSFESSDNSDPWW